jgi:hypothetical protein
MYPVGWQIYAWQEKASGRTFFSLKPTVFTPTPFTTGLEIKKMF